MNTKQLRRHVVLGVFAIASLALLACTNTPEVKPPVNPSPSPAATASPSTSPSGSPAGSPTATASKVDSLVGQWSGVEGTYLHITKKADKFVIELKDLDGVKTYEGTAKGDVIEFTRNNKAETIKTATGLETGMKGFEKETNCVVITKGKKGFCRK